MTDIVDTKTRSRMMSRIRGRDTGPELAVRKSLHRLGFRYRVHVGGLPGRPDLVFPRYRALVFVHGCFWHRHADCSLTTTPSSNVLFWLKKFERTVERDAAVLAELQKQGWRVAVVWECALGKKELTAISKRIGVWLVSNKSYLELPLIEGRKSVSQERENARSGPKS